LVYDVRVAPAAARAIRKLSARVQAGVLAKLAELANDPHPADSRRLEGFSAKQRVYRVSLRVAHADYRIIYQVKDRQAWILVLKVADRKEVYERLGDLRRLLR
jgi:mRNA interferase RelE/StbE